ncbi:MAG: Asp-tRNA(Asn)/Glu-tRNA(Gln) amidotransferase subunit GatA [Patescibacteria group bacterium]
MDLNELTISEFSRGIRKKLFSAEEVVSAYLAEIHSHDKNIGAFLEVFESQARKTAQEVDLALERGEELSPLAGVPLGVKDNILIEGTRTTAGSKILESYVASYDASVIKKLKEKRVVFIGKTNLDEFAMGSSTENSAYQVTKNPHDKTRVPGGSSGGSAAAVASGMALAALGSDTFGSIRQPASFCGIVGLKPTYGAVSRSGLIAMTSSMDQIGPMTKTVEDAALLFSAIAGKDTLDATSVSHEWEGEVARPDPSRARLLRIGIPREYFIEGLDNDVRIVIEDVISLFKSSGIAVTDVSLPHTAYAVPCYYTMMPGEVSANLARFDGVRYAENKEASRSPLAQRGKGFGTEAKRRIILGTFVLSSGHHDAYYKKAQAVRRLISDDFRHVFQNVDVLLSPTAPTPAFKIGEKVDNPVQMYLSDVFTGPTNLAGLPAISIPGGKTSENLPVGFQLIGKHFCEKDILALGRWYENETSA